MKASLVLGIIVCFACFALSVFAVPPVLSGYDFNLDLSNMMANVTPVNDVPQNVYFKIYYEINSTHLRMGIVCNGSSITGTNSYTYCGFGFRTSNASTGMLISDGISGWVTPGGQVQISDLFLDGRNWGDVDTCKGGGGGYICPDSDSPTPCKDDILTASGRRTAEFLVLEYSRRLNTGDTKCDTPIVPGVGIPIIFSIGLVDSASIDPWPYSMLPHDFGANVLAENYYLTFNEVIQPTNVTESSTAPSTAPSTVPPTETTEPIPDTTGAEKSSGSSLTFIQSLIAFSTLFLLRLV